MLNIDDRFLGETTQDQFWLMCHIAKFIGKDSACFPSNQTLCESTGWKISKLNEVKKSCIDAGFLKADARYYKNRQSSNEYTITTDRISIMVNLKGKRAVQIPATEAVGYHAGGTLGTTLAAPPPATLAAPEVLISKEVLTNECERAPAQNQKSFDLNTPIERGDIGPGAGPVAPRMSDFPKAKNSAELYAELQTLYTAWPEEWRATIEATPAQTWALPKRQEVLSRFCAWAITEGYERRTFRQINARLNLWFRDEPHMGRNNHAQETPRLRPVKTA